MLSIFDCNAQAELCGLLQNVTKLLEINNKEIIREVICTEKNLCELEPFLPHYSDTEHTVLCGRLTNAEE